MRPVLLFLALALNTPHMLSAQITIEGLVQRELDGSPIEDVLVRATIKRTGRQVQAAPDRSPDINPTNSEGAFRLNYVAVDEAVVLDFIPPANSNAGFHSLLLLGGERAQQISKRLPPAGTRRAPSRAYIASAEEAEDITNRFQSNLDTLLIFEEFYYRSLMKPEWDEFDHKAYDSIRKWLSNFDDPKLELTDTTYAHTSSHFYRRSRAIAVNLSERRLQLYSLYKLNTLQPIDRPTANARCCMPRLRIFRFRR